MTQRNAQADFDNAEPVHRAKSKTILTNATLFVAKAATGLHAALEGGATSSPLPGRPSSPHRPLKPRSVSARVTTSGEDDMLRQILKGDFLMLSKQSSSMAHGLP